jgi:hypothetical protein
MSRGQKPRWPAHFPRMKVRGRSRRRLSQMSFWSAANWDGPTSAEYFAAREAPWLAAIEAATERFRPAWKQVFDLASGLAEGDWKEDRP